MMQWWEALLLALLAIAAAYVLFGENKHESL